MHRGDYLKSVNNPRSLLQKWDLLALSHKKNTGDHILSCPVDPGPEPVLGADCPTQQIQMGFFAKGEQTCS